MSAAERIAETDRRRAILAALMLAPSYRLALRALRAQLDLVGYGVSLDRLEMDVAWLEEMGLAGMVDEVAFLTARGADVVTGRAVAPGVKRPEPGED